MNLSALKFENEQMQGTLAALFSGTYYFHFVPRVIRVSNLYGREQDQRNRREEGVGSFSDEYHRITFKRLFKTGGDILCDCRADCVVGNVQLAAGLRISHQYSLVGICGGMLIICAYCFIHDKFPSLSEHAIANPVKSLRTE